VDSQLAGDGRIERAARYVLCAHRSSQLITLIKEGDAILYALAINLAY
jgi:hypothetical protein